MNDRGQKQHFSIQLLEVFDAFLIWLCFFFAGALWTPLRQLLGYETAGIHGLSDMMWVVYITVPLTPLILERFGYYDRPLTKSNGQRLSELFRGMLTVGLVLGMVSVFGRLIGARRLILGSGLLLTTAALFFRSYFTTRILQSRAKKDGYLDAVVLAGNEEEIEEFLEDVDAEVLRTWRIVSRFDLEKATVEDLDALLKSKSVQRVIFLTGHAEFDRVSRAVETCDVQGVEAMIAASFLRTQVARPGFEVVGGQPMLVFRSTPELSWQLFAKKVVDVVGALVLLFFSAPFWIAAIIGIRFASPGAPVIFKQQRAGLYGKPFSIYKFRTMVPDAEAMLDQIKEEHGNEVDGPAFKLATDPRIFRFGNFLRKYSIDELPQIINVLRGEMSLVGPRPLPLHEIEAIANSAHRRRLSMKPGITCLWQISGRSDITDFDDWVELDVRYIDSWSIWEDFRILLKTVPAVMFSKGAR